LELLTAGAQRAVRHGATRLVWAARAGEDFEKLSRATEAMVLLEHFAGAGGQASLSIETPLLEMRGEEVVEVGERLGVPWRLSRDCWQDQDQPCGQCPGCVERRAAFGAAEVADPLTEPEAKA
jgi:7-cyano-7-deazaguanine synthase in queuosine biosynthesis